MSEIKLNIGYYDPQGVFDRILKKQFDQRLKIRSLHWRLNPSDALNTVSNVHLNYINDSEAEKTPNLFDSEYARFIFVEAAGVDDYRAKVRPIIRQWLNNVRSVKPSLSYFIILYQDLAQRSAADKYLKTSLINKLRSDFADDELTIENAYRIKSVYSDSDSEREAWNALIRGIKLGIADSTASKLRYYQSIDDHTTSLEHCARLYREIGRYDDALLSYSSLFTELGDIGPGDGFEQASYKDYPLISSSSQLPHGETKYDRKVYIYKEEQSILRSTSAKSTIQMASTLLSLLHSISNCYKRNEFSCVLIEDYFRIHKGPFPDESPDQLWEAFGDLKLAERDELVRIGQLKNYQMRGSMVDLPLSGPIDVQSEYITHALKSEKTFRDTVLALTEEATQYYSKSSFKANTIDTLYTEVALMLYYNTDDYESSLQILNQSFEYYKSTGWHTVAAELLKVYVENLEKLDNGPQMASQLLQSYLQMVSMGSHKFESDRFLKLLANITEPLVVENDGLFTASLNSQIDCIGVDTYAVHLHINSKIHDLEADQITLKLEDGTFVALDHSLCPEEDLDLVSKSIVFGTQQTSSIVIQIGKLQIVKSIEESVSSFQIDQFVIDGEILHNTVLDVSVPAVRHLNKDELLLSATTGDLEVGSFSLEFAKTETDRLVPDAKFNLKVNDEPVEFELEETTEKAVFIVKHNLQPKSEVHLCVPYFFPPDVSETALNVRFSMHYGDYSKTLITDLDTVLAIAVSVQDIFKSTSLFSNYTINSVYPDIPVRIQNVNLSLPGSAGTQVETWLSPNNIIAYIDQGSTFFYKLDNLEDGSLDLTINYDDLQSELLHVLSDKYCKSLDSSLIKYSRLIVQNIISKLQFKFNLFGLCRKVELIDFSLSDYFDVLKLVDPRDLKAVITSLQQLIEDVTGKTIEESPDTLDQVRRTLIINVLLPVVNLVDIVELQFDKQLQYLVCEPIEMELKFDVFILKLDNDDNKKVRFSGSSRPESVKLQLSFGEYEHNWLVCGAKDFTADLSLTSKLKECHQLLKTQLTLVPLRAGKLELPSVEVKNLSDYKVEMEVDYKNSSESLFVVSELNKVVHSF